MKGVGSGMKMISGVVYAFEDNSTATSSDGRFSFDTDSGTHVVEIHSAFVHRLKKYIKERGHLAAFFVNEQPDGSFGFVQALLGDSVYRETIYGVMRFVE